MTARITKERRLKRALMRIADPAERPERNIAKLRRYYKRKDTHLYQSQKWHSLRRLVLEMQPVCNVCKKRMSRQVDHIVPHRLNEDLFYNVKNLQGICLDCHRAKTAAERKKKPRTRKPS